MMQTLATDYSHAQLVDALCAEYADSQDDDLSFDEFHDKMMSMTHSQLIDETCIDDEYTIQEYMYAWS